jgi:hypothetical protein
VADPVGVAVIAGHVTGVVHTPSDRVLREGKVDRRENACPADDP